MATSEPAIAWRQKSVEHALAVQIASASTINVDLDVDSAEDAEYEYYEDEEEDDNYAYGADENAYDQYDYESEGDLDDVDEQEYEYYYEDQPDHLETAEETSPPSTVVPVVTPNSDSNIQLVLKKSRSLKETGVVVVEQPTTPRTPRSPSARNPTTPRTRDRHVTLLETNHDQLQQPLPLPYDRNCFSKLRFYLSTFFVVHPRIYAIYLLIRHTLPRGLVIFDMYTDFIVCYGLYKGNHSLFFMLSSLFIVLPFVLVWSASLRFIQRALHRLYKRMTKKKTKCQGCIGSLINVVLMFYIFPPIGSLIIALYEIYWVFHDIFSGIKAFLFGTGMIEAEDLQTKAMMSYRRTIEIFAESIPQTLLQVYIFVHFNLRGQDDSGIEPNDLYLSIAVSFLNLLINSIKFRMEAKLHGMSWSEYALSALQLAEIPIMKLVPRLPAIRKGLLQEVNFSGFQFDRQSLTPLLEAVNSDKCKLKTLQLSIGSLSNLDIASCKMLGHLLKNAQITVLISRTTSLMDIKNLFESLDTNHNGYLNETDFLSALKTLNCSVQNAPQQQQRRIFQKLAIRRIKQRDRVYFYDFFYQTASIKDFSQKWKIDFNLTLIDFPLHFMFQHIQQCIEKEQSESYVYNRKMVKRLQKNMSKLFEFCVSMDMVTHIDPVGKHVFYPMIDTFITINRTLTRSEKKQKRQHNATTTTKDRQGRPRLSVLAWSRAKTWLCFHKLLKSPLLSQVFFTRRDLIFEYDEMVNAMKLNERVSDTLIASLKERQLTGFNIFEYCLIHAVNPQCEPFSFLLERLLVKCRSEREPNYLEKLMECNADTRKYGALSLLFEATKGFHVMDGKKMTPLQYAARNHHHNVVAFFVKCVFKPIQQRIEAQRAAEQEEKSDEYARHWINIQSYLHQVLHEVFATKSKNPESNILELLLSSKQIEINYEHHGHLHLSWLANWRKFEKKMNSNNEFAAKCLRILYEHGYDFVGNLNKKSKHNILHDCVGMKNERAIAVILKLFKEKQNNDGLRQLLQHQNIHNQTPLQMAIKLGLSRVAQVLLESDEQVFNEEALPANYKVDHQQNKQSRGGGKKWMHCLYELLVHSDGDVLIKMDKTSKQRIFHHFKYLCEKHERAQKMHAKSMALVTLFSAEKPDDHSDEYAIIYAIYSHFKDDLGITGHDHRNSNLEDFANNASSKHRSKSSSRTDLSMFKSKSSESVLDASKFKGEQHIKCVVIGDAEVNKRELISSFLPSDSSDSSNTKLNVDGIAIKLEIVDISGKESYDRLRPLEYSNADVFLVCFSVQVRSSAQSVSKKWVPELKAHCADAPYLVVATNIEARDDANGVSGLLTENEGVQIAKLVMASNYIECSAVTQQGVQIVFDEACRAALSKRASKQKRKGLF